MSRHRFIFFAIGLLFVAGLSSCTTAPSHVRANTMSGSIVGGAAGAIIGNNTGLGSWGGAAAGAVIGGVLGNTAGKKTSYYSGTNNQQFDFRTKW